MGLDFISRKTFFPGPFLCPRLSACVGLFARRHPGAWPPSLLGLLQSSSWTGRRPLVVAVVLASAGLALRTMRRPSSARRLSCVCAPVVPTERTLCFFQFPVTRESPGHVCHSFHVLSVREDTDARSCTCCMSSSCIRAVRYAARCTDRV